MKRHFNLFFFLIFIISVTESIPEGASGLWKIPDLHICVPIYTGTQAEYQDIVDKDDSALFAQYSIAYIIADHACSKTSYDTGLWRIDEFNIGTKAYLVKKDGFYLYECYLLAVADTKNYPWRHSINEKILTPFSSTDIVNISCVGQNSKENYVAFFKFVNQVL